MSDKTNGQLTSAQQKKLDGVLAGVKITRRGKEAQETASKNLARFGNKHLRNRLGIRGTGPHAHGFNAAERKAIREAIDSAFGIKREAKAAPAKSGSGKKGTGRKSGSSRKSTAQLAAEQQARAEETSSPVEGAVVVRQGS